MPQFTYGAGEIAHLKNRDPHLGAAIDRIGWISREVMPDVFTALIHSLVAQQISNTAAATIRRRLGALLGDLTPLRVAQTPLTDLQACGVSRRKAEWIQHVAEQVIGGALDLSALHALPDAEVIRTLSALPGVGVWTAEMLLIFSLGRPDVVSWGDQAIRRGMRRLYGLESLSRAEFARYRERYAPYGSVASFYLWALAGLPAETAAPAYPAPGSVLAGPRSTPPWKTPAPVIQHPTASEYFFVEGCLITEWWNTAMDPAVSLARARVEPGVTTRWHRLRGVTERYLILEGQGRVEVGDLPPEDVGPGAVVLIPPGTRQRITNTGGVDLIFLALCTPRFTPAGYEDVESVRI